MSDERRECFYMLNIQNKSQFCSRIKIHSNIYHDIFEFSTYSPLALSKADPRVYIRILAFSLLIAAISHLSSLHHKGYWNHSFLFLKDFIIRQLRMTTHLARRMINYVQAQYRYNVKMGRCGSCQSIFRWALKCTMNSASFLKIWNCVVCFNDFMKKLSVFKSSDMRYIRDESRKPMKRISLKRTM